MVNILLDDYGAYEFLSEASSYMNKIIIPNEIGIEQMISEAVDPVLQSSGARNMNQQNAQNGVKAGNALQRAAAAVIKMIRNVISSISDFISKIFMSSDERAGFNEMQKKINADPALKGKKLKVKDYRKIQAEYDALIKETEAKLREVNTNENAEIDSLLQKIKSYIVGVPSAATTIVTAEIAMKMAASDIGTARTISNALKFDEQVLGGLLNNTLKKQLGDKEVAKMKKNINACGKQISLRRALVQLRHGKYKVTEEGIEGGLLGVRSILGIGSKIITDKGELGNIARNTIKQTGKEVAKQGTGKALKGAKDKLGIKTKSKREIGEDTKKFWSAVGKTVNGNKHKANDQNTKADDDSDES